jgi:hypothetical protein
MNKPTLLPPLLLALALAACDSAIAPEPRTLAPPDPDPAPTLLAGSGNVKGASGSATLALPTPLASGTGPSFEVVNSQQGGGLAIYLSAALRTVGGGQAPNSLTRPIWIVTLHHDGQSGGLPAVSTSERRVDALGDSAFCLPVRHVTLQPAIEQQAGMVSTFSALPAAATPLGSVVDYAYDASSDLACRGQGFGQQWGYTFLGLTNLAAGGTNNTGAIAIPPGIKLVSLQFDNIAVTVRYEHLALDGTTVIQQNNGQVNNVIGADAGFVRATNTSATTAVKVRFVGTSGG